LASKKPVPRKKPSARREVPKKGGATVGDPVRAFLRDLRHPLKDEIETVRKLVLGASPEISEAIKWNSISFRTTDFFATVHLRSKDGVALVFHRGAKVKKATALDIADPENMIRWLAADRCLVTLGDAKQIRAKRSAFVALVRKWITYVR
jgi:hypothetical protein